MDIADINCEYTPTRSASREVSLPSVKAPTHQVDLSLVTNQGTMEVKLDPKKAPCAVNAISHLADEKYFDDTVCHRVTTGGGLFVLQCGDPSGSGSGGPGFEFHDEYPVSQSNSTGLYTAGTVAMANAGRNTNGSQFFIVYKDSKLPPSYTVLGHLAAGSLEVVEGIAAKGTADGGPDGAPAQPVVIESARATYH
ncbi:peptidylprolyl isomerase [Corynebacterium aquilae]|uniref:peptidylprolyl isomerase n=1 Tax=Corynebacterium aquilae TaxID=203263 RepID=UPI0014750BBE|nr:peptidylprolyl isomerase [Corynebacterium aquilae]